jgi:hypothetical protein
VATWEVHRLREILSTTSRVPDYFENPITQKRLSHASNNRYSGEVLVCDEVKEQVVLQHVGAIFGNYEDRLHGLHFDRLGIPSQVITGLDHCFNEEVWSVIRELKLDKAPGTVGFTARFYQTAWPVIKRDVTNAFMAPWSLDCRSIYLVNQSYMVLFKKKHGAQEVKDFCPISLIHSFCKLAIKALAQWLAPAWTSLFNLTSARSSEVVLARQLLSCPGNGQAPAHAQTPEYPPQGRHC